MPFVFFTLFALLAAFASGARAQSARDVRLLVSVLDATGAILPGATVSVVPEDGAAAAPITSQTANNGVATITGLKPGLYTIKAEFSGFDVGQLTGARLRAGDNRQQIELALTGFQDTVEVGRDAQSAAADPNGGSLTTQLTAEEIEALPENTDDLIRALVDMAGGSATVRVDGFNGAAGLPSRDVIRSIRIIRDTFPAENHSADSDGVEIITQAGMGPIRGGFSTRVRDSVFNGDNPFVDLKAPERTKNFDVTLGGSIVPTKSSFSLFMGARQQFDTPVATYITQAGKQSTLLGRRPNDGWNAQGMLDYALTTQHLLRVSYSQNQGSRRNQGIGGFDLAERAYSNETAGSQLRLQDTGPLGRNMFLNTRLQLRLYRSASTAGIEAQTIRVLDGFTSGGAQVRGGVRQRDAELTSDLNFVRGIHTVRAGIALEGRHYRSDSASNYLGTFIFSSGADYEAGTPRNYTQRIGDPLITYSHLEGALYLQDDLRLRQNLTFSPGLRYEAQTHVHDLSGFGPRLGLTWAPGKEGQTTVRASYGIFHNWFGSGVYEQTLRVNGVRQQEINIVNPTYPDLGGERLVTVGNKYVLGDLKMERIHRFSTAVDRTLSAQARTSLTVSLARYSNQLRGLNLNAPVNGVRPDPSFANIIQVVPDASMRTVDIVPDFSLNFAGGMRNAAAAKWNPRRTVIRVNYRYRLAKNNTDGAFSVPPSGSLDDQWSYASSDTRHRWRGSVSTQALRHLNAQVSWDANSGAPYTLTTGFDDNGDSLFNDRPLLTPRNSARLPWRSSFSTNVSYTIPIGAPQGVEGGRGGGRGRAAGRQRGITFNVSVNNLTNRANYSGFSGVMTSPYFLQATSVANPRQVDLSLRLSF